MLWQLLTWRHTGSQCRGGRAGTFGMCRLASRTPAPPHPAAPAQQQTLSDMSFFSVHCPTAKLCSQCSYSKDPPAAKRGNSRSPTPCFCENANRQPLQLGHIACTLDCYCSDARYMRTRVGQLTWPTLWQASRRNGTPCRRVTRPTAATSYTRPAAMFCNHKWPFWMRNQHENHCQLQDVGSAESTHPERLAQRRLQSNLHSCNRGRRHTTRVA